MRCVMNLRKRTLMNFHYEPCYRVVDDAGFNRLLPFCFECTLITIELIAMTACIVLTTRRKHKIIIAWACFVVYNNVRIFCFPDKIHVTADDVAILIQMTERFFVMALD